MKISSSGPMKDLAFIKQMINEKKNAPLNNIRISKLLTLYKSNDKRLKRPEMVNTITDEAGNLISYETAKKQFLKRGLTIDQEFDNFLKRGTLNYKDES